MKKKLKLCFFRESKKDNVGSKMPALIFMRDDIEDIIMPRKTMFVATPGISGRVKDHERVTDVLFTTVIWVDSYYCSDYEPKGVIKSLLEAGWKLEESNLKA